jgi:hypothetical protein
VPLVTDFEKTVAKEILRESSLSKKQIFEIYTDIKENKNKIKYENIFGPRVIWAVMVVSEPPLSQRIFIAIKCFFAYLGFLISKLRRKLWKNSQ